MRTYALVIGINQYANPEWQLHGAVRDALAFAKWADDEAGLDEDGRLLLLSPAPNTPPAGWRVAEPTQDRILDALTAVCSGAKPDRFLFFFAGHAATPPTRAPEDGPVIVPCDRKDLNNIAIRGVDLPAQLAHLRADGPAEQLYFVDGCREILEVTSAVTITQQANWDLRGVGGDLATQAVLYATRSGNSAIELGGRGTFTRALLEGLSGRGPKLVFDEDDDFDLLTFNELAVYVKERVGILLKARLDDRQISSQLPISAIFPTDKRLRMRAFPIGGGPKLSVRVRVDPQAARCKARVSLISRRGGKPFEADAVGAGLEAVATLSTFAGRFKWEVTAPGYATQSAPIQVMSDDSIFVELEQVPRLLGYESKLEPVTVGEESKESVFVPRPSKLTLTARDREVRITLRDVNGAVVATGLGTLEKTLDEESYYVEAALPGLPVQRTEVMLQEGRDLTVAVGPTPTPLGPMMAIARDAGTLQTVDGYSLPSEYLGDVTDLRLSSLLAYAAWAALWRADGGDGAGFYKLHTWNVAVPKAEPCALMVLVGDANTPATSIARIPFAIRRPFEADIPLMLAPIPGAPTGFQAYAEIPPGPFQIVMGESSPTTFVCVGVPEFVTVLVVAREEWGDIETGQYLMPRRPLVPVDGLLPTERSDVRTFDLAARALLDKTPIVHGEYAGLASGKWSNPLAAVVAGYRLLADGRIEDFGPTLKNLLPRFEDIADLRLLNVLGMITTLADEEAVSQKLHLVRGTPLFARGLRDLIGRSSAWTSLIPEGSGLVGGTLWTTFAPLVGG